MKFRELTATGFHSSKMGIADLPYLGNTAVAEWKGCDPEVWAKIEERMRNGYKGLGGSKALDGIVKAQRAAKLGADRRPSLRAATMPPSCRGWQNR